MKDEHKKYFEDFLRIESKSVLFKLRVKEMNAWDHLRYKVFYDLLDSKVRKNEIQNNKELLAKDIFSKIFRILKNFRWLLKIVFMKKKFDLVVLDYGNRAYLKGRYINNHLGPATEHLSKSRKVLVLNISTENSDLEESDTLDIININFLIQLRSLFSHFILFSKRDSDSFRKISEIINENFECKIKSSSLRKDFVQRTYIDYIFFKYIFRKFKPKDMILCDTGSCKGIYEAASDLKISVYDLQHSLMSEYNILYTYSNAVPENSVVMPKKILTYGEFWNNKYNTYAERVAVGSPFHEIKKSEVFQNEPIKRFSDLDKNKTMIIISGMRSGKKLEEITIKLADQLEEYRFIYKLRTNEFSFWKSVYSEYFIQHPRIFVIDSDSPSLYDLFKASNYQIGVNSTAIVEGMTFNLKTFILNDGWYIEMLDFLNMGYANLVESAQDIVVDIDEDNFQTISPNLLYLENSLENIRKQLDN
tara:strand:- start:8778 stop:10202 length:1425 start_codon:yes stop_codon:yes gene_type:complete